MNDLTWAEKETIAEEVLAWRKQRYTRSFDIECPKCGRGVGSACILMGNAGGPVNHTERVDAATPITPTSGEVRQPSDEQVQGEW